MLQGAQKSTHKAMKYIAEVNGGLNDRDCQQSYPHVLCVFYWSYTTSKFVFPTKLKRNIWSDESVFVVVYFYLLYMLTSPSKYFCTN